MCQQIGMCRINNTVIEKWKVVDLIVEQYQPMTYNCCRLFNLESVIMKIRNVKLWVDWLDYVLQQW